MTGACAPWLSACGLPGLRALVNECQPGASCQPAVLAVIPDSAPTRGSENMSRYLAPVQQQRAWESGFPVIPRSPSGAGAPPKMDPIPSALIVSPRSLAAFAHIE